MSAVNEIIKLAREFEKVQSAVERASSLEQACRETETRLADLRDQESKAGASVTQAYEEAKRVAVATKDQANRHLAETEAFCVGKRAACEVECSKSVDESKKAVAQLQEWAAGLRASIAALEDEETKLGQSVASLRADLASIRAKLG